MAPRQTILLLAAAAALGACEDPRTLPDLEARLGVKELCSALLKGDPAAAAAPLDISPNTVPDLLRRYRGVKDAPFSEVPPQDIFLALPKDQGPIESCRPGDLRVKGSEITKKMILGYPRSSLTVTMRYQDTDSPKLRFFRMDVAEPKAADQQPRFRAEALAAYFDWLALEERFLKALKTTDPYEWMAVENAAAALNKKTLELGVHLEEDTAQPSEFVAQRPAYFAQAKVYAESLDRCAAQLYDISGRMRKRLAEHEPYPPEALTADMARYKDLKLDMKRQASAFRKAR